MIALKINCSKIEKARLFQGNKGLYLDLILIDNRDGKDEFGNDGFVSHSVSKEERDKGVKGLIIGNFKYLGDAKKKSASATPATEGQPPADNHDDVPF